MYNSSKMKKFTKNQIEARILKNKAIIKLELNSYQVSNLVNFIHAMSKGRSIFLTEANDHNSEWNLYYVNEEFKPCIFWVTPLMNTSRNIHGRSYCFRSTVLGMDRILASTEYLMQLIKEITGSYIQLTRSDLI